MPVILIRHGRVQKTSGLPLSSQGSDFASGLADVFANRRITKIMSTPAPHCVATVEPLASSTGVGVSYFSSASEVSDELRQGDYTSNDLVVLFRMANCDEIFSAVGVPGAAPGGSDDAYGTIWIVDPQNGTIQTHATGY